MSTFKATKTEASIKKVSKEILSIYQRKEIAAFALAQSFAVKILNSFRKNQAENKYWINRTQQAFNRVFSNAFKDSTGIGFYIAHGVEYGVYLELANNREHEALRPLISGYAIQFIVNLKRVYGKGV